MQTPLLPSVAVVVPTYNRSRLLARTLRALEAVDYPSFEVMVVDDGSRREHLHAAEEAARQAGVRLLSQVNAGPAAARNCGIAATDSDLVVFLDDDCAPAADWLRRLVQPFVDAGDDQLAAVGGAVQSEPPSTWIGRYCKAARYSTGVPDEITNVDTKTACYRRAVLQEVGGFDESFRRPGGDDPDLARRVIDQGYRIERTPDAVVLHAEIATLREFLTHMYWRGRGEATGKRKQGREWWVLLRGALAPLFLLRRAAQTWRFSQGSGSWIGRLGYAAFETLASSVFVTSSVLGTFVKDEPRRP